MIETESYILAEEQRGKWESLSPGIWRPCSGVHLEDPRVLAARTLFDWPRWLEASFLYDFIGSRLFDEISRLPEYYLTRTETSLLERHAEEIVRKSTASCLVELGAGYSNKTGHLLSQMTAAGRRVTYVPIDVSAAALEGSRDRLRADFPKVRFEGLNATYEKGLEAIDRGRPKLLAFLGSSIGNFMRADLTRFLEVLSLAVGPSDVLLLGVDRIKDESVIRRAYDDASGVTRKFILNIFESLNGSIGSDFEASNFEYAPVFNRDWQQMEMYVRARLDHETFLPFPGQTIDWKEGERLLVEVSRKFDPDRLAVQMAAYGLRQGKHFSDPRAWFSLLLLKSDS